MARNNKQLTPKEANAVKAAMLPGRHTLQVICNKAHCSKTEALNGMTKALKYGGGMYQDRTTEGVQRYWYEPPTNRAALDAVLTVVLQNASV